VSVVANDPAAVVALMEKSRSSAAGIQTLTTLVLARNRLNGDEENTRQ